MLEPIEGFKHTLFIKENTAYITRDYKRVIKITAPFNSYGVFSGVCYSVADDDELFAGHWFGNGRQVKKMESPYYDGENEWQYCYPGFSDYDLIMTVKDWKEIKNE